jgi:hypothetical protein
MQWDCGIEKYIWRYQGLRRCTVGRIQVIGVWFPIRNIQCKISCQKPFTWCQHVRDPFHPKFLNFRFWGDVRYVMATPLMKSWERKSRDLNSWPEFLGSLIRQSFSLTTKEKDGFASRYNLDMAWRLGSADAQEHGSIPMAVSLPISLDWMRDHKESTMKSGRESWEDLEKSLERWDRDLTEYARTGFRPS